MFAHYKLNCIVLYNVGQRTSAVASESVAGKLTTKRRSMYNHMCVPINKTPPR